MSSNKYPGLEKIKLLETAKFLFKGKSPAESWLIDQALWETLAKKGLVFDLFPEEQFSSSGMPLPWNLMSDQVLTRYLSQKYSGKSLTEIKKRYPHVLEVVSQRGLLQSLVNQGAFVDVRKGKIRNNDQFVNLIEQDKTARDLAASALVLNGEAGVVEEVILELYHGRFKDQNHLHNYLQQNRDRITQLVSRGVTNLGAFIGDFTLADRSILPVLIGDAFSDKEETRLSYPLEQRVVRVLQASYSPRFNKNAESVMSEINQKMETSRGAMKRIYGGLRKHYLEVQRLQEALN